MTQSPTRTNVAFIPAKGHSERLPNKNLRTIGGRSLVRLAAEIAVESGVFDAVYVDTESETVAREVKGLPVEWLKRDPSLATNRAGCNDLLRNEVDSVDPAENYFILNCCTPLIQPETIRRCVEAFNESDHDSVITVVPFSEYLWRGGRPEYDLDRVPNSTELPVTVMETHALYGIRRQVYLDKRRRIGDDVLFFETSKAEAVDINTEEDLLIATALWKGTFDRN